MTPEDVQEKINYCEYQIVEAKRLTDELVKHKEECEDIKLGFQKWQDDVNNAHSETINIVSQLDNISGLKCTSTINNIFQEIIHGAERQKTISSIDVSNVRISSQISIYQNSIYEAQNITAGLENVLDDFRQLLQRALIEKSAAQAAEAQAKNSSNSHIIPMGPSANSSEWSWTGGNQSYLLTCSMMNDLVSRREKLENAKNIRTF